MTNEELLKRLGKCFFVSSFDGKVYWDLVEDTPLESRDGKAAKALIPFIEENYTK
jgi:hypothetical protein